MAVIRLLVCGGRDFTDATRLERVLDAVHRKHAIEVLIEGECPTAVNADKLARAWAESRGVPVDPCPVDYALDGPWPGAGPPQERADAPGEAADACRGVSRRAGDSQHGRAF